MFREFGKRGWERILLAKTEVYSRRETSNGRQKEEEEEKSSYKERLKKDRSCSRSRTNFLRKFLPSIVVVVHWIGHHRQRSLCSPYFSFLRDHANEGSIKRGCTAIIIISTNIKWTFTRSKELGFSKGYFRSIRYHLQFLFAQLC